MTQKPQEMILLNLTKEEAGFVLDWMWCLQEAPAGNPYAVVAKNIVTKIKEQL